MSGKGFEGEGEARRVEAVLRAMRRKGASAHR